MYGMSSDQGGPMILMCLMCVLYGVCLVTSLVMAPQDVLIYYKNDEEGDMWAVQALKDGNFKEGLDTWKSLAAVRLVCALVAWLIVCVLTWSNLAVSLRLIDLIVRLRQMVSRRKVRISELEGDGEALAELPEVRLRHLIEVQRVSAERGFVFHYCLVFELALVLASIVTTILISSLLCVALSYCRWGFNGPRRSCAAELVTRSPRSSSSKHSR